MDVCGILPRIAAGEREYPLSVGDRLLDRFRIDAVFTGGMGILWAVTDTHSGRPYAVKAVKPADRGQPGVVDRFRAEALTWIALDQHPHLVQAFWLIEEDPGPYLVLEYVDGGDLARLLEDGALPLERALDLAMQCAAGLHYAHTRRLEAGVGVVHRDVKPSNLLVTSDGVLKIADFGLARVLQTEGVAGGTPAYMAPEQLDPDTEVDGRSDIYSFGLVLYEMLTGANPLQAADLPTQLDRILNVRPPAIEDAPPQLAALVARCVEKDPAARPRDFRTVLAHLAQVARELDYDWHIDPAGIAPPSEPGGLIIGSPVLRPRRQRTGEPFVVELIVRGDVGPGPVDVAWEVAAPAGLSLLTPEGGLRVRVEAGGTVRLAAQASLVASREGEYHVAQSRVVVRGPSGETAYRVPGFTAEVAFAFVLPWRGRDDEAARVRTLIQTGGGAVVAYGEMGMGKTRLLVEAARIAAEHDIRVVGSRAHRTGLRPMRVLNELAREILELGSGRARGVRAAVHDLLGDHPGAARYFADVLSGGSALEHDMAPAHRWYALLRAAARREPLLVLLDDLQNADEAAVRIIAELAVRARADRLPVVLLATSRRRLPALEGLEQWTLAPLDEAAGAALVEAVFPGHGFAEEAPWFTEALLAVTGGNPFHLTEILRALRSGQDDAVVSRDDEWRLDPELSPERLQELVPDALEEAVRARLNQLPKETRAVLDLAGLIGEEFDARVLRAATGDAAATDAALAVLEREEIVTVAAPDAERYRFWSAIVPTAVERRLSADERKRLHKAVADGMLHAYRGEERVRRSLGIAQHLRGAGEARRSLPFTLAGCDRLLSLHLPERARRLLANAEPLLADDAVPPERRAYFHYLYGLACEATGAYDTGLRELTRFVESSVALPRHPGSVPRAHVRLGRIHQARGQFDEAAFSFRLARELYEEMGDLRKLAFVYLSLANLELDRGALTAAERDLDAARDLAQDTGNEGAAIHALNLRGKLELILGHHGAARQAFVEAEERACTLGDRRRCADAIEGLGRVALATGYLLEAEQRLAETIEVRAEMGERPGLARAMLHLGDVLCARGRISEALHQYRRAQRVFGEIGHPEGVANARRQAGLLMRARGKTAYAVRELAAAAEEFRRLRLPDAPAVLAELGGALVDAGSAAPARLTLARADRAAGPGRRWQRTMSRTRRAALALAHNDLRMARAWADRAVRSARRTTGHEARMAAQLALAQVALRSGETTAARSAAEMVLAFARELGDPLSAASAQQVLMELAARAGRLEEVAERAHRAARAYTGRADVGDGPARLLIALARGLADLDKPRAQRYLRVGRNCYATLEAQGFRVPDGV